MFIRFIAHAGFALREGDSEILIDPWFTDSSVKSPLVRSLVLYDTIDFQIPKTKESIKDYKPNAILLSHFHAHHAPHDDLISLVSQSEKVTLGFPSTEEGVTEKIRGLFSSWTGVGINPFKNSDSKSIGPFSVTGLFHTLDDHMAWLVKTETGSLLHLTDARINRDRMSKRMGDEWKPFENLRPDLLCISAGGNSLARKNEDKRYIIENSVLSAVEAARLVNHIKPKAVCLIGCYNWSIWRNRSEYIRPASVTEDELYWGISWLSPEVKFLTIRPSTSIGIGDMTLLGKTDYFIGN